MRSRSYIFIPLCLSLFALPTGCGDDNPSTSDAGGPDAAVSDAAPPDASLVAPLLRNPVNLPDQDLANQALALLGSPDAGGTENCNGCHALTRQNLRYWRALSDVSLSGCLTDLDISTRESARTMIDCLRSVPEQPTSQFDTAKLGIYSTAAHLDWFEFLFQRGFGAEGDWQTEFDGFKERVAQPKGEYTPFTQEEFDIVAEWFVRGLPLLDEVHPEDPAPSDCTPGVSNDVVTHVADMALSGWGAVNAENFLLMYGCNGATEPIDCLSAFPRAGDLPEGSQWEHLAGATLRILNTIGYSSSYWTRSSADGRYVGHGGSAGGWSSTIVDLQDDRQIGINAFYDPGFFPDNSGWVFQAGNAYFCEQGMLAGTSNVTFNEPECSSNNQVGLYQHVGTALGGGDYWVVDSQFQSDNGGHNVTRRDPYATFSSQARMKFTPMIHTGSTFQPRQSIYIDSPYEGDTVISPSAGMVVSRVAGPGDQQIGFALRKVVATPEGNSYSVQTPEIGRYCIRGGKPGFSYDERWMVIHHYVENRDADAQELGYADANDPGFQAYRSSGAANIFLIDLLTGESTRVTHMEPGQYALYPHFRSDGWIYFMVRNINMGGEHIVASDAALLLGNP